MSGPPQSSGIGLRDAHLAEVAARRPALGGLEIHAENWFTHHPARHRQLAALRSDYPLSLHGVGLGLGNPDPPDAAHLGRVRELTQRYQPWLVSEHLCWTAADGRHAHALLPLPYTHAAVDRLVAHIAQVQDVLGRQIAVENVSTYLQFQAADYDEAGFIAEVCERAGCALLLDVNNLYINARNHGFDAAACIERLPRCVREIHVGGHHDAGHTLLDTHAARVAAPVWALYRLAVARFGAAPCIVEWDVDLPSLDVLLEEARQADRIAAQLRDAA